MNSFYVFLLRLNRLKVFTHDKSVYILVWKKWEGIEVKSLPQDRTEYFFTGASWKDGSL